MNISEPLQQKLSHHIKQVVRGECGHDDALPKIIKHIEEELVAAVKLEHNKEKNLRRLVAVVDKLNKDITEQKEKEMIAQKAFDDSLQALTDAVTALSNPGAPSTPDTVVQAYISGVDTNTEHIKALAPTPTPPPTP